jgi:hypothetical protein
LNSLLLLAFVGEARKLLMPFRYYFNLANGDEVIRDEDGIEAPDVRTALIHAFEAIAELRQEDGPASSELQGWRLDILDGAGHLIQSFPLDSTAPDSNSRH